MPYIEENDLLALHEQLEQERDTNNKLQDQIDEKEKSHNRSIRIRNAALGACVLLASAGIAVFFYWNATIAQAQEEYALCVMENASLKKDHIAIVASVQEVDSLRATNEMLKEALMVSDALVYSVQIGAFEKANIPLSSGGANSLYMKVPGGLHAFSIGIFKTLEEAQDLRKVLLRMGFSDAFVASYQNGSRLRLENG